MLSLADAICNFSGFGYNGKDKYGNDQWDLVTNVKPWQVEVSDAALTSLRAVDSDLRGGS